MTEAATQQNEAPAVETKAKRVRKPKATVSPEAKEQQAAAAKKQVAEPKPELYGFRSDWSGPSDVTNKNLSRTKIDPARFNMYPQGTVTERDQKSMVALRSQFGGKPFARKNTDAGILRRLIERGLAEFVSGNPDHMDGQFRLTPAGMGKPQKKAA